MRIKKGDTVARKSYNKDIIFVVDRILKMNNGMSIAILKGMTLRIEADAPLSDLEIVDKRTANQKMDYIEEIINKRVEKLKKNNMRVAEGSRITYTGKILHLDGDRKYSEKAAKYYRKLGLNAVVKNIPESRQSNVIISLLNKYNPDILVITGHDAMIKNGRNYNNIYNYRNSRHFINTVKEARTWENGNRELVIFARSMPKFF